MILFFGFFFFGPHLDSPSSLSFDLWHRLFVHLRDICLEGWDVPLIPRLAPKPSGEMGQDRTATLVL